MKKWRLFILVILIGITFVSAINLDVEVKPISDSYIVELEKPAEFDLIIQNLGNSTNFEIYSASSSKPTGAWSLSIWITQWARSSSVP